ncbi:MAG: HTTM domain-containing protein, partial [Flavobacteriales bacterium]|nr:HTTM domain-containing protein [Flavobacteriales bacterium]
MKPFDKPEGATALGLFRAVFGFFMTLECLYFMRIDFVKNALVLPKVQFSYPFLEWLKPLPEPALDLLVFALLCGSILIMVGKWTRPASIFFSI